MVVFHNRRRAAIVMALCLAGLGVGWAPGARAEVQERSTRLRAAANVAAARHFSASLAIRHRRLTAAGAPLGIPSPDVIMRLTREHRGGLWRTTLALEELPDMLIDAPGGRVRLPNPFLVTRVEFDDRDEEPRMFDRQGRLVRAMSMADLPMLAAAESTRGPARWQSRGVAAPSAAAWLAESGKHAERRQELIREFGPAVGRVRGFDRYVSQGAGGRHEVLVTPDTALPVELNSTSETGEMQTTVAYQAHGTYGHVRRLMRSEHRFAQMNIGRAITEVELGDVVISDEVTR